MQTEEPVFAPHAAPRLHLPEIHHLFLLFHLFHRLVAPVPLLPLLLPLLLLRCTSTFSFRYSPLSLSLSRGDYSSSIREMNRLDSRCANLSDTVRASFSFSTLNCRPGYEAGFVNSCSVWIPKIINLPRFEN